MAYIAQCRANHFALGNTDIQSNKQPYQQPYAVSYEIPEREPDRLRVPPRTLPKGRRDKGRHRLSA